MLFIQFCEEINALTPNNFMFLRLQNACKNNFRKQCSLHIDIETDTCLCLIIKTSFLQINGFQISNDKEKTVMRLSYLYNENPLLSYSWPNNGNTWFPMFARRIFTNFIVIGRSVFHAFVMTNWSGLMGPVGPWKLLSMWSTDHACSTQDKFQWLGS